MLMSVTIVKSQTTEDSDEVRNLKDEEDER